jgi:glycosyltransferase involved in cell wall biosynthesis
MPNVLHISDYQAGGGAEAVLRCLCEHQPSIGLVPQVLTADSIPGFRRTPWGYIASRRAARAVRDAIRSLRPDIIHLHNYYHELSPAILDPVARSNAAVVASAHDHHLVCPNSALRFFRSDRSDIAEPERLRSIGYLLSHRWDHRGFAHSSLKLAQHLWNYRLLDRRRAIDLVIAPSDYLRRVLSAAGLPAVALPNPLAIPIATPTRSDARFSIIFVGRLEPEKGLADLLHALPAIPAHLTVVGDGSERRTCEALAAQLALTSRVRFTGSLNPRGVSAELARAHLLVLPSKVPEAGGLVLIEALAHGTNVLGPDLGAAPESIRDVGLLYDPRDPRALPAALVEAHRRFVAGTLNAFDPATFITGRDPATFARRMAEFYDLAISSKARP